MNSIRRIVRGLSLVELLIVVAVVAMIALPLMAEDVTHPVVYRDRVVYAGTTAPEFHNGLTINGTAVTLATNLAAGGVTGNSSTVLTGAVVTVSASNLVTYLSATGVTNTFYVPTAWTVTGSGGQFKFVSGVCTNKP